MNSADLDFRFYSEGIYDGRDEFGNPISTQLNHAMTIVGYTDDGFRFESTENRYEQVCRYWYIYYICQWQLKPVTVSTELPGALWKI